MKKRWLMLLLAGTLLAAGCGKKKESAEPASEKAVQESAEAVAEENADDAEKDKAAEADAAEKDAAASADAEKAAEETDTPAGQDRYAAFLAGDGKMTVHTAGIRSDGLEFNQLYSEGETLTLQEVMDKTAEFIPGEWAAEDAKIIPSAAAAEIDCGNDGEKELALCITYPVQSESWRQYMILKDQGEELALCYMGCAWSRSDITIDSYGFIAGDGSGGAAIHVFDKSFVDKDGKWQYLYSVETEIYPENIYYNEEFHDMTGYGLDLSELLLLRYSFVPDWTEDRKEYLTYSTYTDAQNPEDPSGLFWDLTADASAYAADSPYRKAFDAEGIEFYPMDEIREMIAAREAETGFSKEAYCSGEMADWDSIQTGSVRAMFRDDAGEELLKNAGEVTIETGENPARIVFTALKPVSDFKILAVKSIDFDNYGNPVYQCEEKYGQKELLPEKPLAAEVVFYGDMPNIAISYTEDGTVKNAAVYLSGKDGSLQLSEF